MDPFTEITSDRNLLHYDEEAAGNSLNALLAGGVLEPDTLFLVMELKFVKTVYVGDTIAGRVNVKSVRRDKPICAITV